MGEFKDGKELHELLLLYDNISLEIEYNGGLDKELAQRLYNVYEAMSDILKDNYDEYRKELFNNPTLIKNFSLDSLQTIYDESSPKQQQWLLDNMHH